MTKKWAERNARARRAGFRNYYHYRKTYERNPQARVAANAAGKHGVGRYLGAGYAAGTLRLPGRKHSKRRGRYVRDLVEVIYEEGGDPSSFLEAIGSPRRGRES